MDRSLLQGLVLRVYVLVDLGFYVLFLKCRIDLSLIKLLESSRVRTVELSNFRYPSEYKCPSRYVSELIRFFFFFPKINVFK